MTLNRLFLVLLLNIEFRSSNFWINFFANASCSEKCAQNAISFDEAFVSSSSIFEGEVIDNQVNLFDGNSNNRNDKTYHNIILHVTQVWKGIPKPTHNFTVQTEMDPLSNKSCDSNEFGTIIGSKYLVYTTRSSKKLDIFEKVSICGRTHRIDQSEAISDVNALNNSNGNITNKKRKLQVNCENNGKGGKGKGGKGKGGKNNNRRINFFDETDCNDEPIDIVPSLAPSQFPLLDITESPTVTVNDSPTNLLNDVDKISNDCQEQAELGLIDPSLCQTVDNENQYLTTLNKQPKIHNEEDLLFKIDTEDSEILKDFTGHTRRRHLRRSSKHVRLLS